MRPTADTVVHPVAADQWEIISWLWQLFRHDLAPVVHGLPYADGRYQAGPLAQFPSDSTIGYLAWRAHPKAGEPAPVGFSLVDGLLGDHRSMVGFWVAPTIRRDGVGRLLAVETLRRHPDPWEIGFQHENLGAAAFWRAIADDVFGPDRWREARREVPGLADVPADHFIESSGLQAP